MGELSDRLIAELIDTVRQQLRKETAERLRDVYLIGDIEKDTARACIERLRELAGDNGKPITLYINSAGGNVTDGLAIHDSIRHIVSRGIEVTIISNVVPVLASKDDPRLPAGRMDRILFLDTYHHIGDRVAYFRRLRAALAPGGRIVVVDWEKREDTIGPELSHRLPRWQVADEMARAGYRLLPTETRLSHQYLLVFAPEP